MDVNKTLQQLYEERRRLDMAIAGLEARQRTLAKIASTPRRGRKSMSEEERRAVSLRMAKYWEARKAAQAASEPPADAADAAEASEENTTA
jgi:hypothetical protein